MHWHHYALTPLCTYTIMHWHQYAPTPVLHHICTFTIIYALTLYYMRFHHRIYTPTSLYVPLDNHTCTYRIIYTLTASYRTLTITYTLTSSCLHPLPQILLLPYLRQFYHNICTFTITYALLQAHIHMYSYLILYALSPPCMLWSNHMHYHHHFDSYTRHATSPSHICTELALK